MNIGRKTLILTLIIFSFLAICLKAGGDPGNILLEKEIIKNFNEIVKNREELPAIIAFIDENIAYLSPENATSLVSELEIKQKFHLVDLEKRYFPTRIQEKLLDLYMQDFDLGKFKELDRIKNLGEGSLQELLLETNLTGYKVETAEGMFFPVIDYEFYKKYLPYLTRDFREYIDLMVRESSNPPAKDAALIIGWDELIERALFQEKFLLDFPYSIRVPEVKNLYEKYLYFIFYGLNNTPLFAYDTQEMLKKAREVYPEMINRPTDSYLLQYLAGFLEILEEDNYHLTEEVNKYRASVLEDIFFSYEFYKELIKDYLVAMQRNIDLVKEESNIQKIIEANYGDSYQETRALKVTEDELLFEAVEVVFSGNYKGHFTPGKRYPYYLDAAMGGQRGLIIKDNFGIWHSFGWRVPIE